MLTHLAVVIYQEFTFAVCKLAPDAKNSLTHFDDDHHQSILPWHWQDCGIALRPYQSFYGCRYRSSLSWAC